jgi:hypothetical protein
MNLAWMDLACMNLAWMDLACMNLAWMDLAWMDLAWMDLARRRPARAGWIACAGRSATCGC